MDFRGEARKNIFPKPEERERAKESEFPARKMTFLGNERREIVSMIGFTYLYAWKKTDLSEIFHNEPKCLTSKDKLPFGFRAILAAPSSCATGCAVRKRGLQSIRQENHTLPITKRTEPEAVAVPTRFGENLRVREPFLRAGRSTFRPSRQIVSRFICERKTESCSQPAGVHVRHSVAGKGRSSVKRGGVHLGEDFRQD